MIVLNAFTGSSFETSTTKDLDIQILSHFAIAPESQILLTETGNVFVKSANVLHVFDSSYSLPPFNLEIPLDVVFQINDTVDELLFKSFQEYALNVLEQSKSINKQCIDLSNKVKNIQKSFNTVMLNLRGHSSAVASQFENLNLNLSKKENCSVKLDSFTTKLNLLFEFYNSIALNSASMLDKKLPTVPPLLDFAEMARLVSLIDRDYNRVIKKSPDIQQLVDLSVIHKREYIPAIQNIYDSIKDCLVELYDTYKNSSQGRDFVKKGILDAVRSISLIQTDIANARALIKYANDHYPALKKAFSQLQHVHLMAPAWVNTLREIKRRKAFIRLFVAKAQGFAQILHKYRSLEQSRRKSFKETLKYLSNIEIEGIEALTPYSQVFVENCRDVYKDVDGLILEMQNILSGFKGRSVEQEVVIFGQRITRLPDALEKCRAALQECEGVETGLQTEFEKVCADFGIDGDITLNSARDMPLPNPQYSQQDLAPIHDVIARLTRLFQSSQTESESLSQMMADLPDIGASQLVAACREWSFGLQARILELEEELGNRDLELKAADSRVEKLEGDVKMYMAERGDGVKKKFEDEIKNAQEEKNELERENSNLKKQLENVQESLEKKVERLQGENQDIKKQMEHILVQNSELQSEMKKGLIKVEQLENHKCNLEMELSARNVLQQELESQLQGKVDEIAILEIKHHANMESQCATLLLQVENLENEKQEIICKYDADKSRINEAYSEQITRLNSDFAEICLQLESARNLLEISNRNRELEVGQLNKQFSERVLELEHQISDLKTINLNLDTEMKQLKSSLESRVEQVNAEKNAIKNEIDTMTIAFKTKETEFHSTLQTCQDQITHSRESSVKIIQELNDTIASLRLALKTSKPRPKVQDAQVEAFSQEYENTKRLAELSFDFFASYKTALDTLINQVMNSRASSLPVEMDTNDRLHFLNNLEPFDASLESALLALKTRSCERVAIQKLKIGDLALFLPVEKFNGWGAFNIEKSWYIIDRPPANPAAKYYLGVLTSLSHMPRLGESVYTCTASPWSSESGLGGMVTAINLARPVIAVENFQPGDLVLFLPTKSAKFWGAFNVGSPHYFLNPSTLVSRKDFLLGMITRVQEFVVESRTGESNIFGLKVGTKYFVCDL